MGGRQLSWTDKYWDLVDDYYWDMPSLGMEPIPKDRVEKHTEHVCVPADLLNKNGGRLCRRVGTAKENLGALRSDEVALNHLLNIGLACLADSVLADLVFSPVGIKSSQPITNVNKDFGRRYNIVGGQNITQHDGFYVSENASVGLEIKLKAKSSWDQIAKYAHLHLLEESHSGHKKDLGLLYLMPASALRDFNAKFQIPRKAVAEAIISRAVKQPEPKGILKRIAADPARYADALERMTIIGMSWTAWVSEIGRSASFVDTTTAGGETLRKVLDGLSSAVRDHIGTEVDDPATA